MNEQEQKLLAGYPRFAIIFDMLRMHTSETEMEILMLAIDNYGMGIQIEQNKRFIDMMKQT